MRFQLKQHLVSIGDDFTINDGDGKLVYKVKGTVLSVGDKLTLLDPSGKKLAVIKQKMLRLRPTYEIHRGNKLFAKVIKNVTMLRDKYTAEVVGGEDYEIKGDIIDYDFSFMRAGHEVATASKKLLSLRDRYTIDVVDGEDPVAILAIAVIIDMVSHNENIEDADTE